jgi:mono/diheme cytochrome c family protein
MLRHLLAPLALLCALAPPATLAQDNRLALSAPQALAESGFLNFLLPRFALKHGVRISVTGTEGAEAALGDQGTPVFSGLGQTWRLSHAGKEEAVELEAWLLSEIGQRTIESFAEAAFTPPAAEEVAPVALTFDGDPVAGERLALQHCGRCHVVNEKNRMSGIGATPSFGVLRTLPDWENRFAIFYVLKPHPAFTQVQDITLPFEAHRPATIAPVEITQDEVEDIAAYAATLAPADLGAPIQSR